MSSLSAGASAPPPQRGPALVLDRVVRRYGPVTALDGVSLAVAAGTVAALVGPNGCGKTTTLSIGAGLLSPDEGRAVVRGHAQPSREARACTAFVPDEPRGLDELTVSEYVALVGALYAAGSEFGRRARALLAGFGLAGRVRTALDALSHGLRRRVSLVAALALAPPVLLVDEATAALDPEAVIALRAALRALAADGTAVLVATQDLHFAETTCDEAFLLSRGRLVGGGPLAALLEERGAASLEEAFVDLLDRGPRLRAIGDRLAAH